MADCREQREAVKFCFRLGNSAAETIAKLKTAYGDAALSKTRVYEWFSHFKNGEMSIEDRPRSGRPATWRSDENVDKTNALIREDRRRTIDQLCEMSGISWSSIQRILSEDLQMGRVAAKFVPRLLTGEQREPSTSGMFWVPKSAQRGPWFSFQGDYWWWIVVLWIQPRNKAAIKPVEVTWLSSSQKSPPSEVKHRDNAHLFLRLQRCCARGVRSPGQTVNQKLYLEVLKRLRGSIWKKRANLWRAGDWFFHHDNAPAHTALSVMQFLTKNGMTPFAHPPYSPDLAPCDFFLFPRLKRDMKGKRFATVEEVKEKSLEGLKNIPISEFVKCFE